MDTDRYCAGIDIGTTKICTIIGRPTDTGALNILGVGMAPSDGLRSGVVVDRDETIQAIRASVQKAEQMADVEVTAAYIGVTGDHIRSTNIGGRVHTGPGGEVRPEDVEKAKQSALDSVPMAVDREVIHTVVRDFVVDGTPGVKRPVGMSGRRLEVELHVVTGVSTILENVRQCVEKSGITAQACLLEPVATARAVLTDAERDLGVLLCDIGGGTTDIAAFIDNAICYTGAVPVAGVSITRDLAKVLRVSIKDAEALKCRYGAALREIVSDDDMMQITKADGVETDRVPRTLVAEIMEARLTEIFEAVQKKIRGADLPALGGVVLSGGGSQAPGTARLASSVFEDLPVRTSEPRNVEGLGHMVDNPIYATGVGLALIAAEEGASAAPTQSSAPSDPEKQVKSWLIEIWETILEYIPR
ncbi:MAG: cell division protein FtsA [Armatimonadota bacterium]